MTFKLTNKWIKEHQGLIHDCISKYGWRSWYKTRLDELYSTAYEALCIAAKNYKYGKGCSFDSYAYDYMKYYINQYQRKYSNVISVSYDLARNYDKLTKWKEEYPVITIDELWKYSYIKTSNVTPETIAEEKEYKEQVINLFNKYLKTRAKTIQNKLKYSFDLNTLERKSTVGQTAKHFKITHQLISRAENSVVRGAVEYINNILN